MSLSMIKSQFKEFINHFERQDMAQVFDYLKSALTEYEENPKQFIENMLNDDVLDVKNEPVEKAIISGEINEKCHICNKRMIDSKHYGVYSCSACYKFFQRSLSSKVGFRHSHSKENPPKDVLECRRCRIDKCMSLGMQIPVKKINYCEICRGIATGVRYGVNSCFQCAKFYSKILTNSKEAEPKCKKSNSCPLDKSITRMCAGCRLQRFKNLIELNNQNKK